MGLDPTLLSISCICCLVHFLIIIFILFEYLPLIYHWFIFYLRCSLQEKATANLIFIIFVLLRGKGKSLKKLP